MCPKVLPIGHGNSRGPRGTFTVGRDFPLFGVSMQPAYTLHSLCFFSHPSHPEFACKYYVHHPLPFLLNADCSITSQGQLSFLLPGLPPTAPTMPQRVHKLKHSHTTWRGARPQVHMCRCCDAVTCSTLTNTYLLPKEHVFWLFPHPQMCRSPEHGEAVAQ